MKVLQINSICGYGSTGKIVSGLHDVLVENGYDCKIAYGLGSSIGISVNDTYNFGSKIDYYIHNFFSRLTDRAGFYSRRPTLKLIKYINEYSPDIIHIHNIHGFYLNIEILFNFFKNKKIPIIWTIHDCWPFTGHCAHYSDNKCYKWKEICQNCSARSRYPKSYIISQAKRNFIDKKRIFNGVQKLYITTPSDWLNKQVKMSFLGHYPILTINNGIDLSIFKPVFSTFKNDYNIKDKIVLLGVSSAWIPQKGLNDFIKLSMMLDDKYVIVIVGMSKPSYKVPPKIIFLSNISNQNELAKIYSAADIYISFSSEETFGLPTIEAMACGTPVLTYNETALPEPVNKNCGIIVKVHDVNAAYNAIKNYPILNKTQITNEAFKYDEKQKYKEFLQLYLEVLNN